MLHILNAYLYHRVPNNMTGDILYPLIALKDTLPEIYEAQAQKYAGREQVMQSRIPVLDCLRNDMLHLLAVHPGDIKQALVQAGGTEDFTARYFQIDPCLLDPARTIVYIYAHTKREDAMLPSNFVPYDPADITKYSVVPEITRRYYREAVRTGGKLLLHHWVPHILYHGYLDIKDMQIIAV